MSSPTPHEHPSAVAAASAARTDVVSPWQSLHVDLLQLIASRVLAGDLLDYVRFCTVCTRWRSGFVVDPRFHPRRWMLLPEGHGLHPGDGKKTFFNLSTGALVHAPFMLPRDCCILDSVDGLLLVQRGTQDAARVQLLNPFTGDFMELPPLMSLVRRHLNMSDDATRGRRQSVEFKSVTSITMGVGGVITVMIMVNHISRVFFVTNEDQQWSVSTWSIPRYSTSIAFQGKFYMLASTTLQGGEQQILQLDPPTSHEYETMSSSLLPPKVIGTCPMDKIHGRFTMAECDSEILVIGFDTISRGRMLVYRVSDLVKGEVVVPVRSIGGNILCLDIDSVEADDIFVHARKNMSASYNAIPEIAGNTILSPRLIRTNTPWHYHLGSGKCSITPTFWCNDGRRDCRGCKCSLIYHIYDCCHCAD